MLRKIALVMALAPSLWLSSAFALGLGDINVHSQLNQRFSAVIPLNDISPEDAGALQVRLADSDAFAKAGIERADYLASLTFQIKTNGDVSQIVISSNKLAREPFLSFLLDVNSKGTQLVRAYTVLLDPPDYSGSAAANTQAAAVQQQAVPAQVASPESTTPAATEADVPAQQATDDTGQGSPASPVAAEASEFAPSSATPSTYGPVRAGETLWSIATKLRSTPSVSMDQVMLAIHDANPRAFDDGHLHVQKGAMLKVPTLERIRSIDLLRAKQRIEQIKRGYASVAHRPAAKERARAAQAVKPAEASPAVAATESVPTPAPAVSEATASKPALASASPAAASTPASESQSSVEPAAATPAAQTPAENAANATVAAQPAQAPAVDTLPGSVPTESSAASSPSPASPPSDQTQTGTPSSTLEQKPRAIPPPNDTGLLVPVGSAIVVLLLGLLGWRTWKKHQDAESDPSSTGLRGPKFEMPLAPIGGAGATPPPVPGRAAPVPPPPLPKLDAAAQLPTFDSRQMIDSPAEVTSTKGISADTTDFDVAGKFEAETMKVDLEGDDPLAEADFHLAYGLYDEAALLLKNAVEKNPHRTELRVKLAETYFRAGKALEFQETAESLKAQVSAAEWQKIAIMGHQLIPDSELFAGASSTAEPLGQHIDLAFDEPAAATLSTPAVPAPAAANKSGSSNMLDFKLEDFDDIQPAKPSSQAKSAAADDNTLEFNLADFDLEKPTLPQASIKPVEAPRLAVDDIKVDDFDLDHLPEDSHAISTGDEAATKLDLARAYVDMGDNETARTLLSEVMHQGNPAQQKDAEALIQRMA